MELKITAKVNPTEDKGRVLEAVENIFPSVEFKVGETITGLSGDRMALHEFKEKLKTQVIRESARAFMLGHIEEETLAFGLNKQAALMGKVNFVDFDVALGTIRVEVKDRDLEGLVDWLCE
jgi:predicted RNA binding protein with dsRBD fold (UPF0201 family)